MDVPGFSPARAPRIAARLPMFSPVVVTGLAQCWMTNISAGGMGLTARVETDALPVVGDDLEVEFRLGDFETPMRAVARVAWTSRLQADGRVGFGVQFRELSQRMRTQLATFLAQHKPRVIVGFASSEDRAVIAEALDNLQLEFVDRVEELDADHLLTSASIILFANDLARMTLFLEALHARRTESPIPIELPIASVTVVTSIDSEELLPLMTAEKIYEVLRPPLDRRSLVIATERSCERWALKLELRWASLQLEGMSTTAARARAPSAPVVESHSMHVIRASDAMKRVYELIDTVAGYDVPVLLTGETGTGKELAARQIHVRSARANTPFIAQDCGALTETLLESELFGHVRGAFTGATHDHPGLFQVADGGTIFLDEIQNTSPALQAKLLRVVEEGEVRPVGGTRPKRVDVRLIAACNVDLKDAVTSQRFRADFYYRLNRFPIALPALRDHIDDVVPLARHFASTICAALKRPVVRLEPRVEATLAAYPWPGNIRELRNAIERALLLTKAGEPIRWESLPEDVRAYREAQAKPVGLDAKLADFERRLIQEALDRNDGIIRRAARDLDVNPVTLARRMRKLELIGE